MRGILAGAFALIVLQVLVGNSRATNATAGVAAGAANAIHWFLDPNTPAIPDHSTATASATTPASPTPGVPTPAPPTTSAVLNQTPTLA